MIGMGRPTQGEARRPTKSDKARHVGPPRAATMWHGRYGVCVKSQAPASRRRATAVAASLIIRPQFKCVTKSKQANLSCHACHAPEQACLSQQSFINIEIIKIIIGTIILPRSWKSPALLDEGNSSCTKGCSVEWESRSKTGAQLSCSTSAMPTKPKHRQTRALGIACHAPELASPSQQQTGKHEL